MSRRALQVSFQDVLGVSPLAYLRLIRLNGARQALLHPDKGLQVVMEDFNVQITPRKR